LDLSGNTRYADRATRFIAEAGVDNGFLTHILAVAKYSHDGDKTVLAHKKASRIEIMTQGREVAAILQRQPARIEKTGPRCRIYQPA
jgi:hypothetical protein